MILLLVQLLGVALPCISGWRALSHRECPLNEIRLEEKVALQIMSAHEIGSAQMLMPFQYILGTPRPAL
jgi:hypothetical protein